MQFFLKKYSITLMYLIILLILYIVIFATDVKADSFFKEHFCATASRFFWEFSTTLKLTSFMLHNTSLDSKPTLQAKIYPELTKKEQNNLKF